MTAAFGGTDVEGLWDWKSAYDACEAAIILFLRKYGGAILMRAAPSTLLLIARLAKLLPTHTRRSETAQAFQHFSNPPCLAFVSSVAALLEFERYALEDSDVPYGGHCAVADGCNKKCN